MVVQIDYNECKIDFRVGNAPKGKRKAHELPELPKFEPKPRPIMSIHTQFATEDISLKDPGALFDMFISLEQLDIMVQHTNEYAHFHEAKKWRDMTVNELRIFITLIIFMGIYKFPAEKDYWKKEFVLPVMKFMSVNRFYEIKRFFHIAALHTEEEEEPAWWKEVEPLVSAIRRKSRQILVPSTQVA